MKGLYVQASKVGDAASQSIQLPSHMMHIGEIVAVYSEARYLENGRIDLSKTAPFLLSMPDNRYFALGEVIGRAWKGGRRFVPTMKG